jgi:O-antigen/teichoic acid export membrane protein
MLAVYSLSVALALNVMVFPGTVGNIFLPVISKLVGKNDMEGVRRAMGTTQRWTLFITMPFVAVMIAFSSEMLSVFYGSAYAGGGAVMAIFCAGLVFSTFAYVMTLALAGMRLVDLEFRVALAVMVANVSLCVLLIPQWGINGAAVAGAASFALSAALFSHYSHRKIGFSTSPQIYRMVGAGAVTCILLFFARPYVADAAGMLPQIGDAALRPYFAKAEYLALLGLVTLLALAVFSALSLLLKCFAGEDVAMVKKAARAIGMPIWIEAAAEGIARRGIGTG